MTDLSEQRNFSPLPLFVRGDIPDSLAGSLLVACSRRAKTRDAFSRWHDSQADLFKISLVPGRPGKVTVEIWPVDPSGADVAAFKRTRYDQSAFGSAAEYGYATQPNHGINVANGRAWLTNLLFGAPLEMEIAKWRPTRVLRYLETCEEYPRTTSTAHFAWSKDRRHAYFQQALLKDDRERSCVVSAQQRLIRLDTITGEERAWPIVPPADDNRPEAANFHSAFYWEEAGKPFVGLLRTGAVVESLAPHRTADDHGVVPMPTSAIWAIQVDDAASELRANLLPGLNQVNGIALSHLNVDNSPDDGFVLYANYKESDVGEETHGVNVYGQPPEIIAEHYSGMIAEAMNVGTLIRYQWNAGDYQLKTFSLPYSSGRSSRGHTWLPINIELDSSQRHLYCSFAGFRPRLLPRHVVAAYPERAVDPEMIRDVPSLLMRFDATTLQPTYTGDRTYLSYNESVAIAVVGDIDTGHVLTFSPEFGLRIYRAGDLSQVICHAIGHEIWHVGDTHFRPTPAHMVFVPS